MHRQASRAGRSVHDLLAPLVKLVAQSQVLRADSLGCWRSGEDLLFLPRFFFQRRKVHKPRIKVGIFAGRSSMRPRIAFDHVLSTILPPR
jgi:hypothetical protein